MTNIYLIGPGGVGKTSTGKLLSKELKMRFVDQDELFVKKYGNIGSFAKGWNWEIYTIRNARHLRETIKKYDNAVIATSPKAFVNPIVPATEKHNVNICKKTGIVVLLLPSRIISWGIKEVFNRTKNRGYEVNIDLVKEESYNKEIIHKYKHHADIIAYDNHSPQSAVRKILKKLKSRNFKK